MADDEQVGCMNGVIEMLEKENPNAIVGYDVQNMNKKMLGLRRGCPLYKQDRTVTIEELYKEQETRYDAIIELDGRLDLQNAIRAIEGLTIQPRRLIIAVHYSYPKTDQEIIDIVKATKYPWNVNRDLMDKDYTDAVKSVDEEFFLWLYKECGLIDLDKTISQINDALVKDCKDIWLVKGDGLRFVKTAQHRLVTGEWLIPTEDAAKVYEIYHNSKEVGQS